MFNLQRVLIFAEQASLRSGWRSGVGASLLPRFTQARVPVWLVCHARARAELEVMFPDAGATLRYVEDSVMQVILDRIGRRLPGRLAVFTTGFLIRLLTQVRALPIVRQLITEVATTWFISPCRSPLVRPLF